MQPGHRTAARLDPCCDVVTKASAGGQKHDDRPDGRGDDVVDHAGEQPEQKAAREGQNDCARDRDHDDQHVDRNEGEAGQSVMGVAQGEQSRAVAFQLIKAEKMAEIDQGDQGRQGDGDDRQAAQQAVLHWGGRVGHELSRQVG